MGSSHGIVSRVMGIQVRFVVLVAFRETTQNLDSLLPICVTMQLSRPSFPMLIVASARLNAKARTTACKHLLNVSMVSVSRATMAKRFRRTQVRVEAVAAQDALARSLAFEATVTNPGGQVGVELQRCRLLAHSHKIQSLAEAKAVARRKSDRETWRFEGAA